MKRVRGSSFSPGPGGTCRRDCRSNRYRRGFGGHRFDFKIDFRMVLGNVFNDVVGLIPQQEVADDGKRGLHDDGAVAGGVKLLRDDGG